MPESDTDTLRSRQKQSQKLYISKFSWGSMPPDPPSRGVAMPHLFVVILCPWPEHSNFACYGPGYHMVSLLLNIFLSRTLVKSFVKSGAITINNPSLVEWLAVTPHSLTYSLNNMSLQFVACYFP